MNKTNEAKAMGKNRARNFHQNNNGYVYIIVGAAQPILAFLILYALSLRTFSPFTSRIHAKCSITENRYNNNDIK